jgi:hypothetical protein
VGEFDGDNRAGIDATLHRISCIRNRQGRVVGLTCRVGRAIPGTADLVEDLARSGKSILLLGPPGGLPVTVSVSSDLGVYACQGRRPRRQPAPTRCRGCPWGATASVCDRVT